MMVGKEDLTLSLTLGPRHLLPFCTDLDDPANSAGERPRLKEMDVNRAPAAAAERENEEEAATSSPNSGMSSIMSGGKREHDVSDEDDADGSRKKLRLSKDQSAVLEQSFKDHSTLNPKQKVALAKQLKLRTRQVEVWFQNRRARTKLKQTEVDCDFLKRCCQNLAEENRRLHKEVQELRALKLTPPHMYMQMTPPTTLTMCPSCQRIASVAATDAAPSDPRQHNHHHHQQYHRPIAEVASFLMVRDLEVGSGRF